MRFTVKRAIVVVAVILILGILLPILYLTFSTVENPRETPVQQAEQLQSNNEVELWKEAERSIQPNSLDIEFNDITTETHWYALLSTYASVFANKLSASEGNPNVIVAPELIPKDTYMDIDGNILNNVQNTPTNSELKADSSIYFQNAYLGKYISDSGQLITTMASLSEEGITVGEEGNQLTFNYSDQENPVPQPKPSESYTYPGITESKYLEVLSSFIQYIYAPTSDSDIDKAKEIASTYFTSDCMQEVLSDTNKYNPDSPNTVEILTIMAGKSDLSISNKDRIYINFKVTNGEQSYTLSLEVKLNNQQRVFDIDLI